jgi:hypothetical protein
MHISRCEAIARWFGPLAKALLRAMTPIAGLQPSSPPSSGVMLCSYAGRIAASGADQVVCWTRRWVSWGADCIAVVGTGNF